MVAASLPLGGAPHHVQVAPDGSYAYVADPAASRLVRIDNVTGRVTATIPVPDAPPELVTFSRDGERAYVSAYTEDFTTNVVVVVDTATDLVVGRVPVGRGPYAVAEGPDGRVYVPLYDDDHLEVVDPDAMAVVARVPMAASPHWIAFSADGRTGYVTNHFSDLVSVLDLATQQVTATIPVGDGPHAIAMSPDGTRAALVNYISGDVTILDPATNTVVATVPTVGVEPQDIVFAPDGRHLYTANSGDGTVSAVDVAAGTVTARVPTGTTPTGLAVLPSGNSVLVTDFGAGTLTMLRTSA
ncbi:cytochrome D1 domain-containing protein [Geodermatophilus sp. SYSU D00691]